MKKFKQWEGFDKILKANGYVPIGYMVVISYTEIEH